MARFGLRFEKTARGLEWTVVESTSGRLLGLLSFATGADEGWWFSTDWGSAGRFLLRQTSIPDAPLREHLGARVVRAQRELRRRYRTIAA